MGSARTTQLMIAAAAVLAVGVGAAAFLLSGHQQRHASQSLTAAPPKAGALPISFATPQFSGFPDQDNVPFSRESLRGKVWIVDFIFTHCANTCPKMTSKRVELQKLIPDPRVTFLSFSVDPDRDDRATRKSYAADHGIN